MFCVFITLHIMCMCPKNVRLQLIRVVYGLWIIKFHVSLLGKKILKTEQVCVFYVIYMYLAIKRRMKLSLFFLYFISSRASEILIMFLCWQCLSFTVVGPTSSLGVCSIPDQCQHFTYAVPVPPPFTTFLPHYTEEFHPTHRYWQTEGVLCPESGQ